MRGKRQVLCDVTLDLPARGLVTLIGPSGAGKSSLVRLLNRLDDPVTGEIRFRGTLLTELPVRVLRRRVAFVFQKPAMFAGSVQDNLLASSAYAPSQVGRTAPSAMAVHDLLHAVELDDSFLARDASGLSGGEQQRVSIARALATSPEVLVLDEPTSALDPEVAERFMATVARLSREASLAVVMVTHRLAEARSWSDVTVMLDAGRVVEAGPSSELFTSPREARTRAFVRSAA